MSSIVFDNIFDVITEAVVAVSELQRCSDLMIVFRDIINDKEWPQKEAAHHLGLTQARISDLKNGKIEKFSFDHLII